MQKQKMKILIVDDHTMVRDGIRSMLESQKQYEFVIEEAISGEQGIEKAKINNYDLILMDYQLPQLSGVEVTRQIVEMNPKAKILAMSSYDERFYIIQILEAGAKGFVLKNIGPDELIKAFEAILTGSRYYSNEVAVKLIGVESKIFSKRKKTSHFKTNITDRDQAILFLIANQYKNEEIGKKLCLTKTTVDKYRQVLLKKLGVKNTAGLIKKAIEMNLLK